MAPLDNRIGMPFSRVHSSLLVADRARWLGQFVHLLGHTGGYSHDEAVEAIDAEGILPDMLTFDPATPARYPNGRTFTDDVIDY